MNKLPLQYYMCIRMCQNRGRSQKCPKKLFAVKSTDQLKPFFSSDLKSIYKPTKILIKVVSSILALE